MSSKEDIKRRKEAENLTTEEKVAKIRAKMSNTAPSAAYTAPELPSMERTEGNREAEVQKLKEKSEDSSVNIVKKVFKQPEVKRVVKFEINREMFISGLFMAFFLVGFFKVFDVAKVTLKYDWTIDLAIGIVLLAIGGIYTLKQVLQNSEKD